MVSEGTPHIKPKSTRLKVLVVENSPTILKILSNFLTNEGCDVTTAQDGLEAMFHLDTTLPDILITDIIMPKISGDQLCKILRQDKRFKDLFIAIHSSTTLEDNKQLMSIGADAYLVKGPRENTREHVRHILNQFRKGIRREEKIIGGAGLWPRAITRELLLARKHHHAIFDNISEAVVELNSKGQIIQANQAAQTLFNDNLVSLLSSKLLDYLEGEELDNIGEWIANVNISGISHYTSHYNNPLRIADRLVHLKLVSFLEEEEYYIIGILQDITLKKGVENRLARTLEKFSAVLNSIDHAILLLDADLTCRMYNQALLKVSDIPKEFFDTEPSLREILEYHQYNNFHDTGDLDFDTYVNKRVEAVKKGTFGPEELKFKNKSVYQYRCMVLPNNGRMLTYFDISSLKQTEAKLAKTLEQMSELANHDPLTGLPNLRLARERLNSTLDMAHRKGWKAAIMFIDLDGFKVVNDSYGHDYGDELLKLVAERLLRNLRQADTVARIGGDEFLIIQTEVPHRFAAANVADKIVKQLATPFLLKDKEITIGASIGIALFPEHGESSRELLKKADDAMYYTKRIGKNGYTFTPS